jgi:Putative Actinobacterial Holin-X, holin superfamily III
MHAGTEQLRDEGRLSKPRPVAAVLSDVVSNLQALLSSEIRLARAQTREELSVLRSALTLIVVGVLAGWLSGLFLLFSAVAALSLVIALWLAALIVGVITAVLCAAMLNLGGKRLKAGTASAAARVKEHAEKEAQWTAPPKT